MPPSTRRTRSKPEPVEEEEVVAETQQLVTSPPARILIHPDTQDSLRIITLPHPRTSLSTRYLLSGPTPPSLHELTKFSDPSTSTSRSWFIGTTVQQNGTLYIATPIDPIFLLLPHLDKARGASVDEGSVGKYLTIDDLEESVPSLLRQFLTEENLRQCCSTLNDGTFYRLSPPRLLALLTHKTRTLAANLPPTIENELVTKQLAPVTFTADENGGASEEVKSLARLKGAMEFISSYLPPRWSTHLLSSHSFAPLENYLAELKKQRSDALAAAAANSDMSAMTGNKRLAEDVEAGKGGDGKKLRKATSQGVAKLKKASTTGMSKLTSFFGKK
ncbi:Ribonuclease H2 subunit B [Saitoella coloradoensis]